MKKILKFEDFRKQLNESEANPAALAARPAVEGGAHDSERRVSVRIRYAKGGFDQKAINEKLKAVGGIEVSKSNLDSGETIELHIDFPTQAKFEQFRGMHEASLMNEGKIEFQLGDPTLESKVNEADGHSPGQKVHKLSFYMGGEMDKKSFVELLRKVVQEGDKASFDKIQGEVDEIE